MNKWKELEDNEDIWLSDLFQKKKLNVKKIREFEENKEIVNSIISPSDVFPYNWKEK